MSTTDSNRLWESYLPLGLLGCKKHSKSNHWCKNLCNHVPSNPSTVGFRAAAVDVTSPVRTAVNISSQYQNLILELFLIFPLITFFCKHSSACISYFVLPCVTLLQGKKIIVPYQAFNHQLTVPPNASICQQ